MAQRTSPTWSSGSSAALEPDDVVLGGGNVKKLKELPPGCRAGDNANAFVGGFRLWRERAPHAPQRRPSRAEGGLATASDTRSRGERAMTTSRALTAASSLEGARSASRGEGPQGLHLRELFADDPGRGERLALEAVGIYLDYSKNRITDETLQLLLQLAEESGLRARIDAMFRGEKINVTEKRAVLHVALRAPRGRIDRRRRRERRAARCTPCSTR